MATDSGTPFGHQGKVLFTSPAPGGERQITRTVAPPKASPPQPVPIYFQQPPKTRAQQLQSAAPQRLGTPVALLMLAGLALVYWALQGWDKKYGTFHGAFSGKGAAGTTTSTPAPTPSTQKTTSA